MGQSMLFLFMFVLFTSQSEVKLKKAKCTYMLCLGLEAGAQDVWGSRIHQTMAAAQGNFYVTHFW